jgi:hypothetical protein
MQKKQTVRKATTKGMQPIILTNRIGRKKELDVTGELKKIENYYETTMMAIHLNAVKAHDENEERSIPGAIRKSRGELVEEITSKLIDLAFRELGVNEDIIGQRDCVEVDLEDNDYLDMLDPATRREVEKQRGEKYKLKIDHLPTVSGKIVAAVESKSYTEATMLKTVLFNFLAFRQYYETLPIIVVQLENAVGSGDNMEESIIFHILSSQVLSKPPKVVTLLDEKRKSSTPVFDKRYYKAINFDKLEAGYETIREALRESLTTIHQRHVYVPYTVL